MLKEKEFYVRQLTILLSTLNKVVLKEQNLENRILDIEYIIRLVKEIDLVWYNTMIDNCEDIDIAIAINMDNGVDTYDSYIDFRLKAMIEDTGKLLSILEG